MINITGVDVETGNPLIISGEEFFDNYDEVIEQGYYLIHDFDISGDIPEYLLDPFSESTINTAKDLDAVTPGFELFILIISIVLLI